MIRDALASGAPIDVELLRTDGDESRQAFFSIGRSIFACSVLPPDVVPYPEWTQIQADGFDEASIQSAVKAWIAREFPEHAGHLLVFYDGRITRK